MIDGRSVSAERESNQSRPPEQANAACGRSKRTDRLRPTRSYDLASAQNEANFNELLDHIIPLALGGHPRKIDNLALQPWEGENGAKKKDRLEVKLQCLVCSGQVALAEAQQEIVEDWQAAYNRYALVECRRHKGRQVEASAATK